MAEYEGQVLERLEKLSFIREELEACPVKVYADGLVALRDKYPAEIVDKLVEIFKAFADPTRLRILKILEEKGEMCVCELMVALQMKQPVTSHHLSVLKDLGLVSQRNFGTWSFYQIKDPSVSNLLDGAEVLLEAIKP